jgi:hypothetical protein
MDIGPHDVIVLASIEVGLFRPVLAACPYDRDPKAERESRFKVNSGARPCEVGHQ